MKKIIALLITVVLLSLLAIPAYADDSGSIALNADKSSYNAGDTVKVNVVVTNANDLYGIELNMTYDPEFLSLDSDGVTNVAWTGGLFQKSNLSPGVRIVATKLGDDPGINGNATLITFKFTALKNGNTTVDLSDVIASDSNGVLLDINSSASVNIKIGDSGGSGGTNKTALNAAIAQAQALDSSDYTSESWNVLVGALNKALAVKADSDATQDEIDDATDDLLAAIDALVEAPEEPGTVAKSALQKAINDAKALDKSKYTEDSWDKLEKALDDAEQVLADADATQEEVDDALEALNSAVEGLVEKSDETPGGNDDEEEEEDEDEEEESPQTGVNNTLLTVFIVMFAVSGLALLSIISRNKKMQYK